MTDAQPIAAIVLAAGRSSRMGQHKLLLSLGGRPLITYALRVGASSGAADEIVVLGHDAEAVRAVIPAGPWRIVECADYAEGMSASLRSGIQAVPASAVGAVILLADQPLVTELLVCELVSRAAATPERILATRSSARPSTPVYFPRTLFGELMDVTGDEGGRSVIARHDDLLDLMDPTDDNELLDVDDPLSLQSAREIIMSRQGAS